MARVYNFKYTAPDLQLLSDKQPITPKANLKSKTLNTPGQDLPRPQKRKTKNTITPVVSKKRINKVPRNGRHTLKNGEDEYKQLYEEKVKECESLNLKINEYHEDIVKLREENEGKLKQLSEKVNKLVEENKKLNKNVTETSKLYSKWLKKKITETKKQNQKDVQRASRINNKSNKNGRSAALEKTNTASLRVRPRAPKQYRKCTFCDFLGTLAELFQHVNVAHGTDQPYACQQCEFRTKTRYMLNKHSETHNNDSLV